MAARPGRKPAKRLQSKVSASKAVARPPVARDAAERAALIAVARAMATSGLTPQRSGNASLRVRDGVLITPSGKDYAALEPSDLVFLPSLDSEPAGDQRPSSEWPMHRAVYRARSDILALVHTHSPFATALACAGRDIPAFHYMVARAGGDRIPCAAYATFGTPQLAQNVAKALAAPLRACLIANHGAIAGGRGIESAYALATEVETLAQQFWNTLQIGVPRLLDRAEMARVRAQFEAFGMA